MRASVGEACRAEQARRRCQSAASSGPAGAAGRGQRAPGSEAFEARLGGVWDGTERLRTAPWKPGPSPSAPWPCPPAVLLCPEDSLPSRAGSLWKSEMERNTLLPGGKIPDEEDLEQPSGQSQAATEEGAVLPALGLTAQGDSRTVPRRAPEWVGHCCGQCLLLHGTEHFNKFLCVYEESSLRLTPPAGRWGQVGRWGQAARPGLAGRREPIKAGATKRAPRDRRCWKDEACLSERA